MYDVPSAEIYYNRGLVYYDLLDYEKAYSDFNNSVFENNTYSGVSVSGISFSNSDNLLFKSTNSFQESILFKSSFGLKFSNCDYLDLAGVNIDPILTPYGIGLEFDNCDNSIIQELSFGAINKALYLGFKCHNGSDFIRMENCSFFG